MQSTTPQESTAFSVGVHPQTQKFTKAPYTTEQDNRKNLVCLFIFKNDHAYTKGVSLQTEKVESYNITQGLICWL